METLFETLHIIVLIFLVLMVFNLMIVVHEWGHFLAARWRGLKVDKFYVWFGKPIWKKTINGVEYGLGTIPMGGFVALPQMAPMEAIEGKTDSPREALPPITPLDKIIVAFAGPLFSFALAALFAVLVWVVGKPVNEIENTSVIGTVAPGMAADRAGLKPGDEILSIDGKPARTFFGQIDSVPWGVISSEGEKIDFLIRRPGEAEPMHVMVDGEVPKDDSQKEQGWLAKIFMRPGLRKVGIGPVVPLLVDSFIEDEKQNPGKLAGLQPGDMVRKANGVPMLSPDMLAKVLADNPGKPLELEVDRPDPKDKEKKTTVKLTLTPRPPDQRPADWTLKENSLTTTGVIWNFVGPRVLRYPTPGEQLREAARTIYDTLSLIIGGKSEVGPSQLSGAIGIGRVYYHLLQDPEAVRRVMWFSVVLNVNLAILNMLPFPVLDGGHIVMALYEWIRRKPIHIRLLEVVQTACVALLLFFMVFVSLKDIGDLFGIGRSRDDGGEKKEVLKFGTPPAAAPAGK
jgi:regulator of sigma E protease